MSSLRVGTPSRVTEPRRPDAVVWATHPTNITNFSEALDSATNAPTVTQPPQGECDKPSAEGQSTAAAALVPLPASVPADTTAVENAAPKRVSVNAKPAGRDSSRSPGEPTALLDPGPPQRTSLSQATAQLGGTSPPSAHSLDKALSQPGREGDRHRESGILYDPGNVKPTELDELRRVSRSRGHRLMTAADFVDRVFYPSAKAGATIVGFNLPFDISRLAIGHEAARAVRRKNGTVDRSMQGGFTFKLSTNPTSGNVRVKHLSRRAAFINFARPAPERGFFLDLRTLSAALTSQSHTLDSLAKLLKTETGKAKFEDFDRDIDEEFISYAIDDVQVTRECYDRLILEYAKHGFSEQTPATRIYSEASLGKAYLEAMNIRSWRQVQRDFPDEILGAIMGSYFGGRAEVHWRREVVRTLYCDFASMYPTVCTLQGLWRFVVAMGVDWMDATEETEGFLAGCELALIQDPATWLKLPTLVKVLPDADIFPVRARYGPDAFATIGLNHLSSDRGLWFTLADCIASKLLTGKAPKIERAVRFSARSTQRRLASVDIAGNAEYRINPATDDFYK